MSYGFKVIVEGDYACFTRPELKVERVSYDVPTPGALEGLLKSVYWKPAIRYVIDKIIVFQDIDQAVCRSAGGTVRYLQDGGKAVDPMTIRTYNFYKKE